MSTVRKLMDKILETVSMVSLICLIATVLIQVFARFFLPKSPAWTEELSRVLFVTAVFYAVGLAKRDDAYVNVDIATSFLSDKAKKIDKIIVDVIMIIFMSTVLKETIGFIKLGSSQSATTLPIHMSVFYSGTFVATLFFVIYSIIDIFSVASDLKKGDVQQ